MDHLENIPPFTSSSLVDLNRKGTFDLSNQNNTGCFGFPLESSGRSQKDATFPRKILAEMNRNSISDSPSTPLRKKSPNRKLGSGYSAHYSDDCSQVDVMPYDPMTNCFTPRPRFLRYDPQRRREWLLQTERQMLVDDGEGSAISLNDWLGNDSFHQNSKASKSISGDSENGVIPEDEDEECYAEKDERRALRFGALYRALLLLGALYLSSCFIFATHTSGTPPITWELRCPKGDYVDDHFVGRLIVGDFDKCIVGADEILSNMVEEIRGNSMLTGENEETYAARITGNGEERNIELATIVELGGGQSSSIDDVQQQTMEVDEQLGTSESGSGSSEDISSSGMLEHESVNDGGIGIENYEIESNEDLSPFNLLSLCFEKEHTSWILHFKYVFSSLAVLGVFLFGISRFLNSGNGRNALKKTTSPPASASMISDHVDVSSSHRTSDCAQNSTHPPMVQLLGEYSLVREDSYASNEKDQSSDHVKGMLLSKECVIYCAMDPKEESKSHSTSTSMGTAKKSRRKKHMYDGQETSNQDIMITPVRRSNRIRNQALRC